MVFITVPDMNDSMSLVTLDEKEYVIRFTYSEFKDYWSFSLYDGSTDGTDKMLIGMTKIIPNFPLTQYIVSDEIPSGTFAVVSSKDHVGRNDFNEGYAEFVFISDKEV